MKKTFTLLLFGLSIIFCFGQKKDSTKTDTTRITQVLPPTQSSTQQFPFLNVISPSPEAASLGRYGEVPVSLSSGTASIEVPIYEVISGSLKVPVKLTYHSMGTKVNDVASSVGTGWALQAGGVITRAVKGGLWDECTWGILHQIIPEQTDTENFKCYLGNLTTSTNYVDGMPDDFFYNFNGMSGKFLYNTRTATNQNTTPFPVTYPFSYLKIDWVNELTFTITDLDGTVYKFENIETTKLVQSQSNRNNPCGVDYTSAWYLSQIISANKIDVITFTYTTQAYVDPSHPLYSTTLTKKSDLLGNTSYSYDYASQKTNINSIILQEINYKNGKVTFTYANDRQDQSDSDAKRLTTITIYQKDASDNFQELKHFSLSHSYFSCADGYTQIDHPTSRVSYHTDPSYAHLKKRLRLDSVREYASNGSSLNPYSFTYYEDQPMAMYGSLAQDYWGYSNGAMNNTKLLLMDTDPGMTQEPSGLYGANCSFNFDFAVSGALKRMTYPTKGYTDFFYEAQMLNDGTKGGGIRIKKMVSSDNNNAPKQTSYNYIQAYFTNSAFSGDVASESYIYTTEVWTKVDGSLSECQAWAWSELPVTTYSEKVSFSLGSAATFVAYEEVEEYQEDGLGNRLGKVNYTYSVSSDLISADFPLELIPTDWKRGLLRFKKVYSILPNNSEVKILEEETTYTEYTNPYKTRGYLARLTHNHDTYRTACPSGFTVYCDKYSAINEYIFQEINQQSSIILPTQTKTTTYDQNGLNGMETITTHQYGEQHYQLNKTTTTNSDGNVIETLYHHPHEFEGTFVYDEMVNRHIFSPIIETEQRENSVSLKKVRTNYKQWYPGTLFGGLNGFFAPLSVETQENGGAWETEVMMGEKLASPTQNGYDLRARPVLYTERNGITTQLDWWDESGKKDFVKKKTVGSQFVNYDYEPNLGLKSILDQNSLGTYFTYDIFKRLKLVKDQELNLTDSYTYAYAGSTPGCTPPSPATLSIGSTTLCDITINATGCGGTVNWSNGSVGNSITVSSKNTLSYTATCIVSGCISSTSNSVTTPVLPIGWTALEIGSPPIAGCIQENSGTWTIKGSGNTFNASDNINYVYKPHTGNSVIVAKIISMSSNTPGIRSGVMLRSSTSPTADYFQFFFDSGNQVLSLFEQNIGTGDQQYGYQATTIPSWIRLKKDGTTISVWYSQSANPVWNNDADWTLYTSVTSSNFNGSYLLGILAYNNAYGSNSLINETQFTNVSTYNF